MLGWAAASRVSTRAAYRGVIEHSVYIHRDARGQGLGRLLLDAFVTASDAAGFWTIQSSIFPENTASLRVHQVGWIPLDRARANGSPGRPSARTPDSGVTPC